MSKAIVYQGANEQFRVRVVDDEDNFVNQSQLFETKEEAIEYAETLGFEYEVRPTIQEVAEGEE